MIRPARLRGPVRAARTVRRVRLAVLGLALLLGLAAAPALSRWLRETPVPAESPDVASRPPCDARTDPASMPPAFCPLSASTVASASRADER